MEKKKELCRNCGARYARCKKCNERFCFRCAFKLGAYDNPYDLPLKDKTACPECARDIGAGISIYFSGEKNTL